MDRHDLDRYFSGRMFDAYRYFGAQHTREGTVFRVCAPHARRVALIGEWNGWQETEMIRTDERGIYTICSDRARPGQLYKYRVYESGKGRVRDRADPFARQSELRPGTASVVPPKERFHFTDKIWRDAQDGGHYDRPMNIYELHIGSWRRHMDGSAYGYRALAAPLIQYCKEHFYTHVEFLPLAEHPFDGSWGYQVGGYFSVTSRYGSPDDFCWLVNELHKAKLGVIMDFVPVHFIPDDFALFEFDGTAMYEYDHDTGLAYSEWGSCNFDPGKPLVRSFLQSAADFWLSECHVDGLRFDAVRNLIYIQGDEKRGENGKAIEALKLLNAGLKARHPDALLIAEDSTSYPKVTAPVEYDGLGFDYKWDLGWMNDTLAYLELPPSERPANHHRITFSMSYFYNDLFLLPLSHDEVVHGKKTVLDKMWGEYEQKFAQCRTLYTYLYTHPGKKLGFMGNELGSFREWDENRELDWQLLSYPIHSGFDRYLIGLAGLYRSCPALHEGEYHPGCFRWLEADDSAHSVYAYERAAGGDRLLMVLNLSDRGYHPYRLRFDGPVTLRELVNSDYIHYGGTGDTNEARIDSRPCGDRWTAEIRLAPFGSCIFRVTAG